MAATALISAGAQAAGGLIDNVAGIFTKKKDRKWQERMMDKQNAYNSPVQQMERLKQAGLNPHLVYGSGSAVQTSASPASPPASPEYNFGKVASDYITNRLTARQEQNAIATNENIEANTANVYQQMAESEQRMAKMTTEMASILQNTARSKWDLEYAQEMKQTSMDTAVQNLENLKSSGNLINAQVDLAVKDLAVKDANISLSNAQVRKISSDIKLQAQQIVNLKTQNKGQAINNAIQEIKKSFWQKGINPDRNAIEQILQGAVNELRSSADSLNPINNLKDWGNEISSRFKSLFNR